MFNSQACESKFREIRSSTTSKWTKINYTLLEIFNLIGRFELQDELAYFKFPDYDIKVPRIVKKIDQIDIHEMPTNDQINSTKEEALNDALNDCKKFGMNIVDTSILNICDIKKTIDSTELEDDEDEGVIEVIGSEIERKAAQENPAYTTIFDKNGEQKLVRKSSIVWQLTNNLETISNDRLTRVKGPQNNHFFSKISSDTIITELVMKFDEIELGQWCFFESGSKTAIVGRVIGFIYKNGRNESEKQCSLSFVPVSESEIAVLASWYQIDSKGTLKRLQTHSFADINSYLFTVIKPSRNNENLFFESNVCQKIQQWLSQTIIIQK